MKEIELKKLYECLSPLLNERTRRRFAGSVVKAIGQNSLLFVARILGMSRNTIIAGLKEIDAEDDESNCSRIRKEGGGRKQLTELDASLLGDLESLVEPLTRGDPMSPLRWTCKSTANLSKEMKAMGHKVSARTVASLLKKLKYSLHGNRKTYEGKGHPDRNAQFDYINETVKNFQSVCCPVISVDAKKKEIIGNFKNAGKEWYPQGMPEQVNVYDFLSLGEGRATPYGVYDIFRNEGWVSVGIDHDTSTFAIDSILQWWQQMGKAEYSNSSKLLITADGGGSNGHRNRLWKMELQRLADQTGLEIHVCHFPPGTSKWNKIEHKLFSFISMNWRGQPLRTFSTIVNLISATTNQKGLKVQCQLNTNSYPLGTKVSNHEIENISLYRDNFHGDWNYFIIPRTR